MRIAKKYIYKQVSKPKNIARAFNGHICGVEEWMKLDMLEKYSGARALGDTGSLIASLVYLQHLSTSNLFFPLLFFNQFN